MIGAWDPTLGVQRYARGLEGLIAGESAISKIDGARGRLSYRGYAIEELAARASFEEVSHLVLFGELPDAAELAAWSAELRRWREVPAAALAALERLPRGAHPLAKHRTMLTVAACEAPATGGLAEPARLLSWSATLAAAAIRHLRGLPALAPPRDLGHAASFLAMTLGREATAEEERAFEVSLIVQAEHGLHAAALAALVVCSTGAELGSALLAGMGALSGVRHGGANQLAFEVLEGLVDPETARRWAREAVARRERIPGFGHRVYRCPDPRVRVLEPYAEALCRARGLEARFATYRALRDELERSLGPRGIYGNVDGITGLVYHPLGLPASAFPIPFCLAIQTGWLAHCLEYRASGGRMIEPGAVYLGPGER
jgi:citrate synthase